ncbi:hypothetical protein F4777DRAFT_541335 [Nemania sp. FL0916]|nr:hypothetical protein F4777DRAFT_541335 [Nemania sp. FL0916]
MSEFFERYQSRISTCDTMSKPLLTDLLLGDAEIAASYQRATQAKFLRLGGQGRLPHKIVSEWLSQDRLYAQAYLRFISGLISRAKSANENDKISSMLQKCLDGILRELTFFEETAKTCGLDLLAVPPGESSFGPNKTTGEYIDLFDSFAADRSSAGESGNTLMKGLLVLWATEKAYLAAWTYAREQKSSGDADFEKDLDGGALRTHFIPNWTSQPFQELVKEIQECLDTFAETQGGYDSPDGQSFSTAVSVVREVFRLEEGFWPVIEEDGVA